MSRPKKKAPGGKRTGTGVDQASQGLAVPKEAREISGAPRPPVNLAPALGGAFEAASQRVLGLEDLSGLRRVPTPGRKAAVAPQRLRQDLSLMATVIKRTREDGRDDDD